ncbi:MAG: glycoside hydrolase family 3 protein, partial [Kiritimatiellia bacterium]
MSKKQTLDKLLGALSPEEKAAQLMVLGYTGSFIEPELLEFIDRYGLGGLRLSPFLARKFIRYLPDGSPGLKNVLRPKAPREKMFDDSIPPPYITAPEYAEMLNVFRRRALARRNAVPLHMVMDAESGESSNFISKGMITPPECMGLGDLGDVDLVRRVSFALGKQLKAVGIDMLHSPVVDVNTNPSNPGVYTRSYNADPDVVTKCARAALEGFRRAKMISCLKHYPGSGASATDSHYGISSVTLDKDTLWRDHLAPYHTLCREGQVPAIMLLHSIFPGLDPTGEIATVSPKIVNEILRGEIGFDGVITTDSMTMGGLMAKYDVGEACIRALEAGVDILLLKDDNVLRWEMHASIVAAIRSGRISEERVNQSLRRIWSMKYDYGLFKDGGLVDPQTVEAAIRKPQYRKVGLEAARRVIRTLRDEQGLLPLQPSQKILLVDRVTYNQRAINDSWNHPGMLWECVLKYAPDAGYVDYTPKTTAAATKTIEQVIKHFDIIVATGSYTRGLENDTKPFLQTSEPVRQVNLLIFMQHYLQPRQAMIRAVLMMPDIFVHHMEL